MIIVTRYCLCEVINKISWSFLSCIYTSIHTTLHRLHDVQTLYRLQRKHRSSVESSLSSDFYGDLSKSARAYIWQQTRNNARENHLSVTMIIIIISLCDCHVSTAIEESISASRNIHTRTHLCEKLISKEKRLASRDKRSSLRVRERRRRRNGSWRTLFFHFALSSLVKDRQLSSLSNPRLWLSFSAP